VHSRPHALRAALRRLGATLRRIVGAPDYEAYLAHVTTRHPDAIPLSREAFARDARARRDDRPRSRSC
jgi:uncharacterized short protein YbdD (DUF466 family)